ncbi:MAG: rhamnulokinase [Propionibacterium sp.]|nr:rhamnulokinase [Propionibacterium sp.]
MRGVGSFAAVDLGATSGRVMLATLTPDADGARVDLRQVRRFSHDPLPVSGELHWNVSRLFSEVREGLRDAERLAGGLSGIGVDTWAVDYGLLDRSGALLGDPFNYRDPRTLGVPEQMFAHVSASQFHARCGLQVQPFNTIFQLVAAARTTTWADVRHLLLMPDLFGFWLTGRAVAEITNASTTGLLDVRHRIWSRATLDDLRSIWGIPAADFLPDLVEPGTVLGPVSASVLGTDAEMVAVGTHDTASAIVAVPASGSDFAYISSGTWSLVGLELDAPVLTEASREANFTNELGVDGTVRYLRNITGLWVLSESIRTWAEAGLRVDLANLIAAASDLPALGTVVDINDATLLPPGDMPTRIAALAAAAGEPVPHSPAEFTRCILDSLALAHRLAVRQACELAGRDVSVVHMVGGGTNNELLCRLTAEATGLTVVAGPDEGTALGNVLVQARALGALEGDLDALRRVAAASCDLTRYRPGTVAGLGEDAWRRAERRITGSAGAPLVPPHHRPSPSTTTRR